VLGTSKSGIATFNGAYRVMERGRSVPQGPADELMKSDAQRYNTELPERGFGRCRFAGSEHRESIRQGSAAGGRLMPDRIEQL